MKINKVDAYIGYNGLCTLTKPESLNIDAFQIEGHDEIYDTEKHASGMLNYYKLKEKYPFINFYDDNPSLKIKIDNIFNEITLENERQLILKLMEINESLNGASCYQNYYNVAIKFNMEHKLNDILQILLKNGMRAFYMKNMDDIPEDIDLIFKNMFFCGSLDLLIKLRANSEK